VGRPGLTVAAWGATAAPHYAYLQDKRNGATLETIGAGPTLPSIETLIGRYTEVDARTSILRPKVPVAGSGELVNRGAVRLTALLDAIATASASGTRQRLRTGDHWAATSAAPAPSPEVP
jgi:hypothetical protein